MRFERLALSVGQRRALSAVLLQRRHEGVKASLLGGVVVFIALFLVLINMPAVAVFGAAAVAFAVGAGVLAGVLAALLLLLCDSLYWRRVLSRETDVVRATGSFEVRRAPDIESYPMRTVRTDRTLGIPEDAPEISMVSAIDYTGRAGYVLALFDAGGTLVYRRGTYDPSRSSAERDLADKMALTQ